MCPLAELIAFIIVPAHRQLVFLTGAELIASVFFTTVLRVVATWAIKTDYAQTMMRNITEAGRAREFERFKHEL
jgi:hypothetical protein